MSRPPGRLSGWASRWLTDELASLAQAGQWDTAIATFTSMTNSAVSAAPEPTQHQPVVNSNVYHYTTIISGCGRAMQWEAALSTFSHMQRSGVEANVYTYTTLIDACAVVDKCDLAFRVFAHMRRHAAAPPNVKTMTSLVKACARQGQWERAMAVLDSCDELLIAPNVLTYTSAIDACKRAGKWEEACALLLRMSDAHQVRPNHITYNAAIASCVPANAWIAGLHVFAKMRSEGFAPVEYTRSNLLLLLSGSGHSCDDVVAMKVFRNSRRHDSTGHELANS